MAANQMLNTITATGFRKLNKSSRRKHCLVRATSPVAQMVKCLSTMRETWVRSLGGEDPLEEDTATDSSILAWRISMDGGARGLRSMGLQRAGYDRATKHTV